MAPDKQVLYFGAPWCPACTQRKPMVQQVCADYDVPFLEHNIDHPAHKALAERLGARAIPFVAVVSTQGEVLYTAVGGLMNRDAIAWRLLPTED